MVNFKFSNNGRKCIRQILHPYQSGNWDDILKKMIKNLKIQESLIPIKGESIGYTVKSMEKDFPISNFPLEQTEFLYDSKKGTNKRIYR